MTKSGKPIIALTTILNPWPKEPETPNLLRGFEIGHEAHRQVEAKFNHDAIKERPGLYERDDYAISFRPDIFYDRDGGFVVEAKSFRDFTENHARCINQLSALCAMLGAKRSLFIVYQLEFNDDPRYPGDRDKRLPTVSTMTPVCVPLVSPGDVFALLDDRARAILADVRKTQAEAEADARLQIERFQAAEALVNATLKSSKESKIIR